MNKPFFGFIFAPGQSGANRSAPNLMQMKRILELLAPGGDIFSIKAAIAAGADAVYCGLNRFNARNRGTNITFDELHGVLRLAHKNNCKVYLTLNIIIVESEVSSFISLLNKLVNTGLDGIIIQDPGMLYLVSTYFKQLKIHASTQLTTHNEGQVSFLRKLSVTRVNLSRELNIREIKALCDVLHENQMLAEVFVHGSTCICFSGMCYISSYQGGNSGNRGRCSQPCRDQYLVTQQGRNFPLNLKDNSAWSNLQELYDAGVDSLKIEGRIKKFHYVYTVTDAWRKRLRSFYESGQLIGSKNSLYKVFNRDFSNGFLSGNITGGMFIDNPRDHSAVYLSELNGDIAESSVDKAKGDIYEQRAGLIAGVENVINQLDTSKAPALIILSGKSGMPLKVTVITPDETFVAESRVNLSSVPSEKALSYDIVYSRLKAINETAYFIRDMNLDDLAANVFLPFNELTSIKKRLLTLLNGSAETMDAIGVPTIERQITVKIRPTTEVLISSPQDLYLLNETSARINLQLPGCFKPVYQDYCDLCIKDERIVPWFPSVLIGEHYSAAVDFLCRVRPRCIVTNNTGIAFEADKAGISWIAGPGLNIVNSFSLTGLKDIFNCAGAYISNELSKMQIQQIKQPAGFKLYYSIYHPDVIMTSRQCLFLQITGCEKETVDEYCLRHCKKTSYITNLKHETFAVTKSPGNYHQVCTTTPFLNLDIVTDLPGFFDGFLINLSDIGPNTHHEHHKSKVIKLFENFFSEIPGARSKLEHTIMSSHNTQYKKGI